MRAGRVVHHVLGPASSLLIAAAVATVPSAHAGAVTARATPEAVLAGTGVLNDVVTITPRNTWAVGHYGSLTHPKTLVEHWNGTAWHRISVSPAAGWLNGVAATSARDIWAVGISGTRALILHFNGTGWRRVASPAVGKARTLLTDITAMSPHDAWTTGITGNRSLIEHWNGTAWRRISIRLPADGGMLIGVYAASGRSALAVGCTKNFASTKARPLVLHWNGTAWK